MRKKTSFDVDERLWSEFKVAAIRQGKTVTELLEHAMKKELKRK